MKTTTVSTSKVIFWKCNLQCKWALCCTVLPQRLYPLHIFIKYSLGSKHWENILLSLAWNSQNWKSFPNKGVGLKLIHYICFMACSAYLLEKNIRRKKFEIFQPILNGKGLILKSPWPLGIQCEAVCTKRQTQLFYVLLCWAICPDLSTRVRNLLRGRSSARLLSAGTTFWWHMKLILPSGITSRWFCKTRTREVAKAISCGFIHFVLQEQKAEISPTYSLCPELWSQIQFYMQLHNFRKEKPQSRISEEIIFSIFLFWKIDFFSLPFLVESAPFAFQKPWLPL